jgi:hypothetical protein
MGQIMKTPVSTIKTLLAASALSFSAVSLAGPTIYFGDEGFLQFNYALQVWSQQKSYTSATNDASSNDIFLRRNRLTFLGQQSDLIGFYAQIEAGSDSKFGNDEKSVYFRDAYITIDYSDELRFIVGRFKNTFSRENLEACLEPLTLDRGDITYSPFGGSRDTGAVVWGNLFDAKLQYRFMVADGREGEEVATSSPRITGRVHWSIFDPEYDYGYRGTYLGTQKVLTFGAAYDFQADAAYRDYSNLKDKRDYKAWTVDGFFESPYKSGTYTLAAAYFNYSLGNAINHNPDPKLPASTELEGFYVKAGYLFPDKVGPGRLQLFARHDGLEYNLNGGALDRRVNAVGANYYLNGQALKLTAEYQRVDYANPDASNFSLQDFNQFTFGFQFIF